MSATTIKKRRAGSITQRKDGLWQARVRDRTRPGGTPDRRHVYVKTRGECQRKLDDLRRRVSIGQLGDGANECDTMAAYLVRLVEATRTSVRPRTHKRYGELVHLHIAPVLGRHKLSALAFERALGRVGLPRTICFHDLRHGAITMMLSAGEPVAAVSEIVGHHSSAMTHGVHGHVIPGTKRRAAERLAGMLPWAREGAVCGRMGRCRATG